MTNLRFLSFLGNRDRACQDRKRSRLANLRACLGGDASVEEDGDRAVGLQAATETETALESPGVCHNNAVDGDNHKGCDLAAVGASFARVNFGGPESETTSHVPPPALVHGTAAWASAPRTRHSDAAHQPKPGAMGERLLMTLPGSETGSIGMSPLGLNRCASTPRVHAPNLAPSNAAHSAPGVLGLSEPGIKHTMTSMEPQQHRADVAQLPHAYTHQCPQRDDTSTNTAPARQALEPDADMDEAAEGDVFDAQLAAAAADRTAAWVASNFRSCSADSGDVVATVAVGAHGRTRECLNVARAITPGGLLQTTCTQLKRSKTERFTRTTSNRNFLGSGVDGISSAPGTTASMFLSQGLLLSAALRMSEGQAAQRMAAPALKQQLKQTRSRTVVGSAFTCK